MRIAILETIVMPAGHEVEFDRILVEELKRQGHEPRFFVPEKFPFKINYGVPVDYLRGGTAISYAGVKGIKKIFFSIKREYRRNKWFNDAYIKAEKGIVDGIIIPTASWRFLKAIVKSKLCNSRVPVLIILHGIMPKERKHLLEGIKKCSVYDNIHIATLGLQSIKDFQELVGFKNFHTLLAPVYRPFDLKIIPEFEPHKPLRLGFFGQYRKEKNLDFFLEAFNKAKFNIEVELIVQGATVTEIDSNDFERLIKLYANNKKIKFMHKNLLGIEWQKAIMDIDIMLIPYGAERYRYQPSAMLFTAMGYYKPVLQSPEMNPEILSEFKIGEAVKLDDLETFKNQLECFINSFKEKQQIYRKNLELLNVKYGHENFIKSIMCYLAK